ncbi:helix-turn-helix transcriptional regulator [Ferruginibacter profundus]
MEKTIHQGHNIKRFREMLGIKQEALAHELGTEWNQKKISLLEGKEVIDDSLLEQLATVLKIPVAAIKSFDEEAVVNIISNTVHNHDNASANSLFNYYPTFNPIEKIIELYDALLKSEKEKVEMLQKLLDGKK